MEHPQALLLATPRDEEFFLACRNDPAALRASRRAALTPEEHHRWWESEKDYRFVITVGSIPVGTVRLGDDGMVSIVLAPRHRGLGYATQALRDLRLFARRRAFPRIWAEIAPENLASQRAFLRAGFAPILLECSP